LGKNTRESQSAKKRKKTQQAQKADVEKNEQKIQIFKKKTSLLDIDD